MYNTQLNNYHLNKKNSTIYTPPAVSEFIFELLKDKVKIDYKLQTYLTGKGTIIDPCCGMNSLLKPWEANGFETLGIDIDPQSLATFKDDFLVIEKKGFWEEWVNIITKHLSLILCNPPFNGSYPKLAPELWLNKIIELFGKDIPLVLFVPAGFRLNLTLESERHRKFEQGEYPSISSIITLPKNIFAGVKFHSEILIFNIRGLEPHYFYSNNHE